MPETYRSFVLSRGRSAPCCSTLLVGVPSNNQLALTLLRIGELEKTPLPPPPSYAPEKDHGRSVTPEIEDDLPNVNPDTAIEDLSDSFPDKAADDEDDKGRHGGKTKKKLDRFVNFVKGSARTSAIAVLSTDRLKAKTGSPMSKDRQDALDKSPFVDGPSVYNCHYGKKKGWLLIVGLSFARHVQSKGGLTKLHLPLLC